ncbi:cerberus-like [Elgaria multicarinata webbii]|uniref:cerberus-like n=1 Tax=Elgaria multicarinata webbii TaxID=159646 RepID=UPI002FCD116B
MTKEPRGELQKKKRRIPHLLPRDVLMKYPMDYKGTLAEPGLFVEHLLAEMENGKQDGPRIAKFISPYIVNPTAQDFGSWAPTTASPHQEGTQKNLPSHPHSKREAESPLKKDAKKFWDIFMLKTQSRSEEIVLPIKTKEMYQETCSTLPFSQSIVHENCEKLLTKNNLCLGKYSSFHVPGLEDRLYTFCSHCLPTKFSMNHLETSCTMAAPVINVVMLVEECKCEVQKMTEPDIGFLHWDLYAKM